MGCYIFWKLWPRWSSLTKTFPIQLVPNPFWPMPRYTILPFCRPSVSLANSQWNSFTLICYLKCPGWPKRATSRWAGYRGERQYLILHRQMIFSELRTTIYSEVCKKHACQVKIKLLDSAPMQIDGEPWEQHPAEISLTHHAQVKAQSCIWCLAQDSWGTPRPSFWRDPLGTLTCSLMHSVEPGLF